MKHHWPKFVLAAVVAVLVVLYAAGVLPHPPNAEQVISSIAETLGPWTYLLVGLAAFLETGAFVGLIAPGETIVLVGGVVAGEGQIDLIPLIGLVWVCCVLGDTTSFFIGRKLGRGFMLRHGPRFKIDEARLEQVESYFERHGGKTILIGRFVGLVRAVSPFIAGSSGFPYRRFLPYSVVGCGAWGTLFSTLGYLFYRSFDKVSAIAGRATLGFGIVVVVVAGAVFAYRKLRDEEERERLSAWLDRQGRRPLLRPVAAVVRPLWSRVLAPVGHFATPRLRFLWDRLTPGDLGLELTTALTVAGIGAYVFALYTSILAGGTALTPADRQLLDLGDSLRSSTGTDIAEFVTGLGTLTWVLPMLIVVVAMLAVRGYRAELTALVVGAIVVYAAMQLTKNGIDRPRPAAPLVKTDGSSFPSGHAAMSTAWVAASVALASALPGATRRTALVVMGVLIAVLIGLSRIYLRAHYWSDVAGGWGLGAAVFGICAAVAIVVARIRNNGRSAAGEQRSPPVTEQP